MIKPQTDGFEIVSAHDVRKLHDCVVCADTGMHGHGMVRIKSDRDRRGRIKEAEYAHVPCYVALAGLRALVNLPPEERDTVRPMMDLIPMHRVRFLAMCSKADKKEDKA